jgi:hypothetical protein
MEPSDHQIAADQRRARDFMADALGLQHAEDEAHRAARWPRRGQPLPALLREQRRLRQRVAELAHELKAVEAELDALDRAIDGRIAAERERRSDDI